MALKLDNSLLEELGLGALPDSEKQLLLRQIYEKLEMNVGMRLADQMSNEQLDAFEKFVDANDDKGAFQWLETNFPNYKQVVNEEFEKLKNEIRSVAPQILASANQQATMADAGEAQGQMANPAPAVAYAQPAGPQAYDQPQPQVAPAYPPQDPMTQQASSIPGYGLAAGPQYAPQPQYQQPAYAPPVSPAQQPYPPAAPPDGAVPQNGHLQPQYGQAPPVSPQAGQTPDVT